ncbi:DUF2461 domain-containing protein [Candidatus Riflebacteria bacterium]
MPAKSGFTGFPLETMEFYAELSKNNNREWFLEHKNIFLARVMTPAKEFVMHLGHELLKIHPQIGFDPRTNGQGSIFRIYRDVRFSRSKLPYKTHLGIFFWLGMNKKESPGYYFHLENNHALVYAGMHCFSKKSLESYRISVSNKKKGDELKKIFKDLGKDGYELGGLHYKRVPRGFEPDHPHATLLKFNTLFACSKKITKKNICSAALLSLCLKHCRKMSPLNLWIKKNCT